MAYRKREQGVEGAGILEYLALAMLVFMAVAIPFAVVFGPELFSRLYNYFQPPAQPPPAPVQATDFDYYFSQKNKSCSRLSEDFLIVTSDSAYGDVRGLAAMPGQGEAAQSLLSQFEYNQTTRTYVRGDWMKRVIQSGGANFTTIWKDGRIYQCGENCTMKLLGDAGWQAHLDSLQKIRTGCAYFGRTKMPESVNMSRLLKIERVGKATLYGSTCERFVIAGDKSYASSLLNSTTLDQDQQAVLWSITHLAYPAEECLDEGSGILVSRTMTLDLTGTYRLDYSPGGFMHIVQKTDMTYFSDYVPASFFTAN
ncbi:MAG TPA: hypothetical protein VLD37_02520 [Candidatus Bilamarchaeum sp.]|nr:hypothetical protein [Candidatus Bilamarchaeum sp.]